MTPAAVRTAVLEALHAIAPDADLASLAPGAELRSTLDLDSFDFLQLLIALKRRLGVEVPDAVAGELTTLERLVDYLVVRLPGTEAGAAERAGPPAPGSGPDARGAP